MPASLFVGLINKKHKTAGNEKENVLKVKLWKDVEKKVDEDKIKAKKDDEANRKAFGAIAREGRDSIDGPAYGSWGYTTKNIWALNDVLAMSINSKAELQHFIKSFEAFFRNKNYKGIRKWFSCILSNSDTIYNSPGPLALDFATNGNLGKVVKQYLYAAVNGQDNTNELDVNADMFIPEGGFGKYIGVASVYGGGLGRLFFSPKSMSKAIAATLRKYKKELGLKDKATVNVEVQAMYGSGNANEFSFNINDDNKSLFINLENINQRIAMGVEELEDGQYKYYVAGIGDMLY